MVAVDKEFDALSYALGTGPSGATIDNSGVLNWISQDDGSYTFSVIVSDGISVTEQFFDVEVKFGEILYPEFTSDPPRIISINNTDDYFYNASHRQYRTYRWYDPVSVTEFVEKGPEGMRFVDFYNEFNWGPTQEDIGVHQIVVGASDGMGRVVYQEYDLTVTDALPPVFQSLPPTIAYRGEQFVFTVVAVDPEGDELIYGFENYTIGGSYPPEGMMIDSSTGVLTFTPGENHGTSYGYSISANDGRGGAVSAKTRIYIYDRPVITSTPIEAGVVAVEYSYDINATSSASLALQYELIAGPQGVVVDQTSGLLTWIPIDTQLGESEFTVRAFDSNGAEAFQTFTVTITDGSVVNKPPILTAISDSNTIVGVEFALDVDATDPEGEELVYSLLQPPVGATIDAATGQITWTPTVDQVGENLITVQVADEYTAVQTEFTVTVLEDDGDPMVAITNPAPGPMQTITAPINVTGTITDPNLSNWRLVAQRKGTTDLIPLATGTSEKSDEYLGEFDPSMLVNGIYTIAIEAFDTAGNSTLAGVTVVVDGQLKVGNFSITFNDLSIPMVGIPIEVNRTYDSRRRGEDLDFGYGWSIDYQNVLVSEARTPGRGWELKEYGNILFGDIVEFCVEPLGDPWVTVRLPDGNLEEFVTQASPKCNELVAILDVNLEFEAKAGTTSTLKPINNRFGRLDQNTGEIGVLGGDVLDPSLYELTTKAGYVYRLNQDFGIETVTDPNGHTLTYSNDGIVHSAGKRIDFVRDGQGRITEITDPSGNIISYNYDANDDLSAVTDREFATTNFTYLPDHGLVDIIDPLGRRIVRNIYDDDGRLIAQEDNEGNRTEFNHNIAGKESVVTDRLGRNTLLFYDDRGNVTSKVDALGNTYSYTFDQFDNQLTETNPLGHITSASFDERYNQLTQTDPLGNTVSYAYNALGQETSIVDARGNAFNNTYDAVGNLLTVTDPLGNEAGQNINAQGLATLRRDAEGNDTLFEYDSEGNLTKETDAEGGITSYTYDANNNRLSEARTRTVNGTTLTETTNYEYNSRDQLIKTTDALGNVSQTEYDQLGRETAQIDAKGRRTNMAYDSYGRLTQTTYPDGTAQSSTYDLEGNKLTDTDRLGRTTSYEYDALNRQLASTYLDSSGVSSAYDAAGRMISETDERGNTTSYGYDAADRRTSSTDALNNTMSYGYDADGNMTSVTDARGNSTTHTYNGLDQRTQTTYSDNTSISSTFDKRGLEVSKTDQNGITTRFNYDGLGRLISVTDALNQVTAYGYDEVGNKLTQTDALGRITSWAYDAINRPISRTLPMGQQETYAYDAVGNRTSHTDFNGATHTFSYDTNNDWLVSENWADGSSISYTYNAIGQRSSANDSNGTFTYSYDNRDRLVREVKHDGSELLYGYDATGNRTSLTTVVAGSSSTTDYTFDALNRQTSVSDANGSTTSYTYDANGNQTRIDQANGTATVNVFDALNRVTTITHIGTANETLGELNYTLDASGRRTAITESNGRTSNYGYDALYRLTSESIIDSQNGNHNATFVYDAISNRTQETVNGVQANYAYDANDRLLTHGADSYSYDNNGNTVTELVNGQSNSYTYDSRNRLIAALKDGLTQTMTYDPDSARIQVVRNGDTTDYLVDANRDYAQVLYERGPATELSYTFGTDLVGLDTGVEQFTYHTDALGSTRLLTNGLGTVADDIRYDAWGEVLAGGDVGENQYLYTGEQFDAGLEKVYLRARYYDAGVGRFSQMDEWLGIHELPISQNKYLYAAQDPLIYTDPSGESFTLTQQNIAAAVFSIMVTAGASSQMPFGYSSTTTAGGNDREPSELEMGLLLMFAHASANTSLLDLLGVKTREKRDDECGLSFGPFYRYELEPDKVAQARAGWLYGTAPQGGGLGPTVQAYNFKLKQNSPSEVKFCTGVKPGSVGGPESRWYVHTVGVVPHDDKTIKIRIQVIQ